MNVSKINVSRWPSANALDGVSEGHRSLTSTFLIQRKHPCWSLFCTNLRVDFIHNEWMNSPPSRTAVLTVRGINLFKRSILHFWKGFPVLNRCWPGIVRRNTTLTPGSVFVFVKAEGYLLRHWWCCDQTATPSACYSELHSCHDSDGR